MSSRDGTSIEIRCDEWPVCAVPSGMHKDVRKGKLNKEQVYTYYVMRVWGRKNGHVWRNREDLAREIGFRSTKPLKAHLKALIAAGWIDRNYQPPDLEHSYPRYVLTLRTQKRTEDTCQCWFKCGCGKPRSQVRSAPPPVSSAPEGEGSCGTPQGGALDDPPKDEEIEIEGFREAQVFEEAVKERVEAVSREGSVEARTEEPERNEPDPLKQKLQARATAAPAGAYAGAEPAADPTAAFDAALGRADADKQEKAKRKRGPKRSMRAVHGEPQWPPRDDSSAGYDVACKWIAEMRERVPKFGQNEPGPADVGSSGHLAQQVTDPDNLLAIIRVAIWDWDAIREEIETWYTKEKPEPKPQHILQLLPHLATRLESGVISPARRVSAYKERWILGTWRDRTKPRAGTGPTLAEKARREMARRRREGTSHVAG